MLAKGNGSRTFYVEQDFWASSVLPGSDQAYEIEVRQIDLNDELAKIQPSFLIIDIEGGEIEFLSYANLTGVQKICIETHPGMLTNAKLSKMLEGLFSQGFALDFSLIRKNVFYLYRP